MRRRSTAHPRLIANIMNHRQGAHVMHVRPQCLSKYEHAGVPARRAAAGFSSFFLALMLTAAAASGQDQSCLARHTFAPFSDGRPTADIEHVRLELSIDPVRTIAAGRVILTLRTDPVDADSVRLIIPAVEVESVASRDLEKNLPFRIDGKDTLLVDLAALRDTSLVARESITLEIDLSALYGIRVDRGYAWPLPTEYLGGSWFPWSGDASDHFTSELHITTIPANEVVSTGSALARRETDDGRVTHLFSAVEPHRAEDLSFAVGPFERSRSGYRIETLYPPTAEAGPGELVRRALEYFEAELEFPYPFGVLRLVVIPGLDTPVSAGGLILVPPRLAHTPEGYLPRYSRIELVEAVASQWFGEVVRASSGVDLWLVTGLPAYLAAVYAESEIGTTAFEVIMRRHAEAFFDHSGLAAHSADLAGARSGYHLASVDPTLGIARSKGAWTAHSLRRIIGDDGFWETLIAIVSDHAFATISTADFAAAADAASGESVDEFLQAWITSEGYPELASSYSATGDTLYVTIEQRQLGENVPEVYDLELGLEAGALGTAQTFDARLDELRKTFALPFSADPRFVVIDHDMRYLMEVRMEQSLSSWIAQLRGAASATGRLAAARGVAQRRGDPDVLIGLRSALAGESDPYVKAAILDVIRELSQSEAAQRALISAYDDSSAVVRLAALNALAAYPASPEIEQIGLRAANEDPVAAVQAAAVELLASVRSARAQEVARAALITPSHDDVIRRAGLRALGLIDAAGSVTLEAGSTYSDADHFLSVRLEAIRLLEQTVGKIRRAENVLIDRLSSNHPSVRLASAEALLRLGNESAVGRYLEAERIPYVQRRVAAFIACR